MRAECSRLKRDRWAVLFLEFWGKTHHAGFSGISAEWLAQCQPLPIIPAAAMLGSEIVSTRSTCLRRQLLVPARINESYDLFAYLEHISFHVRHAIYQALQLLDGPTSGRWPQLIDKPIWDQVGLMSYAPAFICCVCRVHKTKTLFASRCMMTLQACSSCVEVQSPIYA